MISTKNLCLIEISTLTRIESHGSGSYTSYFSNEKRYTLAKAPTNELDDYHDIFTHTIYKQRGVFTYGEECVTGVKRIITSRKFIKKSEAIYIIQASNPNYLPKKPKTLNMNRKQK